jgi:hypothetical protein
LQEPFQGMEIVRCHDYPGTKERFPGESRNKLTYHDT